MSAHRLPDNIDQWPRDPYSLLGVTYGTNRRDVRKAYSRLIKTFKPEHYPDQFQRIRDAFETVDQRAAWIEANVAPAENPVDTVPFAEAASSQVADAHAEVLDDEAPEVQTKTPSNVAPQGALDASYSNIAQRALRGEADEELYARLFWMLGIDRALDAARDPRDWLIAGMKRCGLRGRLPELYRNELADDPREGLHRRAEEALRCSGHQGLLVDLAIARWDGATRFEQWEVIPRDLAALRGRLQEEPAAWSRLLLAAIDRLSWAQVATNASTLAACRKEIEHLAEHWPAVTGELDERDGLAELVQSCDQIGLIMNLPAEWRKSLRGLLKNSWNRPLAGFRTELLDVLLPLVQNPITGLEALDRLEARCRPALHRLGALITMLFNETGAGHQDHVAKDVLDRLVDFLVAASKKRYPDQCKKWMLRAQGTIPFGRRELLMFCIEESITARQLIHYLAGSLRQDLIQFIAPAENAPLNFVCLAYQAFWA